MPHRQGDDETEDDVGGIVDGFLLGMLGGIVDEWWGEGEFP